MEVKKLVHLINSQSGENIKVNWTGVFDRFDVVEAKEITINRGNGFEQAIEVVGVNGKFLYFGSFEIHNYPTDEEILMFNCSNGIFIKNK